MIFFCIIVHLRQHPWRDTTDTEINILFAESPELPKVFSVSWSRLELFKTFSRAVSRCMGAAMICLAWMSSAVLYSVVSRFLARPVERKCYSVEPEDSLRPLFKAIVYSRSWVRNSVNSFACFAHCQDFCLSKFFLLYLFVAASIRLIGWFCFFVVASVGLMGWFSLLLLRSVRLVGFACSLLLLFVWLVDSVCFLLFRFVWLVGFFSSYSLDSFD